MRSLLQVNRLRYFTTAFVSRFVALVILSSFAVTQLAIVSTLAEQSAMPCCVGKTEGHCDSGLAAPKTPEPVSEPMCGLPSAATPALDLDDVTVVTDTRVTEPVHAESHSSTSSSPFAESNTVEKECQMDCGACATATSRHKRDSVVLSRFTNRSLTTTKLRYETASLVHSSNEYWTPISPRGPPSTTL